MLPVNEKQFSPSLQIVDAVALPKNNRARVIANAILISFFGSMFYYMIFIRSSELRIWHYLIAGLLLLVSLVVTKQLRNTFTNIGQRSRLESHGVKTIATLVGRELEEGDESDTYWIYYQFSPDFVAKYRDETEKQYFFNLPLGGTIEVLYLPDSPKVTGVASKYGNIK